MFDWSEKNADKSGKSQGILISCVSGNPDNHKNTECTMPGNQCEANGLPDAFRYDIGLIYSGLNI